MNITDSFIKNIITLSKRDLPNHIIDKVKQSLTDYIGVTLAGSHQTKEKLSKYITDQSGEFAVIGYNETTDFLRAAFVNGYNSHVMEMDDGHRFAMLHLSSPIFSAMLSVAQKENLSFITFAKAVVVGFEVVARLAMAMQPSHKQRGYHATGTCGACGVALAVAYALNFSFDEMKAALSAAATSAAGLLESIEGKSQMKPYNIAMAVQNGITATYFTRNGFCGPDDILGGKRGLFNVLSDEFDTSKLIISENDKYAIEQTYTKPYAACRHCHAPIEAALKLTNANLINHSDVERVEVYTYKLAVFGHDHTKIDGENSAKMSIPYSVAVAIVNQSAVINDFRQETIKNEDINNLCSKVLVFEDEVLTKLSPAIRAANVKIFLKDSTCFSLQVDYPKGEPENPLTKDEAYNKFFSLAVFGGKTKEQANEILSWIDNIEIDFKKLFKI
ncbi:MAG: MmgE/PrpD family protein [bacterium]